MTVEVTKNEVAMLILALTFIEAKSRACVDIGDHSEAAQHMRRRAADVQRLREKLQAL